MNGFFLREKYSKALNAIDSLDHIVGGDPLLNYYRGNIYSAMGQIDKSVVCFETVTKKMP